MLSAHICRAGPVLTAAILAAGAVSAQYQQSENWFREKDRGDMIVWAERRGD